MINVVFLTYVRDRKEESKRSLIVLKNNEESTTRPLDRVKLRSYWWLNAKNSSLSFKFYNLWLNPLTVPFWIVKKIFH